MAKSLGKLWEVVNNTDAVPTTNCSISSILSSINLSTQETYLSRDFDITPCILGWKYPPYTWTTEALYIVLIDINPSVATYTPGVQLMKTVLTYYGNYYLPYSSDSNYIVLSQIRDDSNIEWEVIDASFDTLYIYFDFNSYADTFMAQYGYTPVSADIYGKLH